jgi:hypothetical protein
MHLRCYGVIHCQCTVVVAIRTKQGRNARALVALHRLRTKSGTSMSSALYTHSSQKVQSRGLSIDTAH